MIIICGSLSTQIEPHFFNEKCCHEEVEVEKSVPSQLKLKELHAFF